MSVSLTDIEAAARRLQGVAVHTPLLSSLELNDRAGAEVYIKAENLQHIGAFKFRGAYNRLRQFDADQRAKGAVAFSSGNHAQGVALAARLLGMPAVIVMPEDAPKVKIEGTRAQGAEIRLYNRETESREQIADEIAGQRGMTVVPAFDDPSIIAGQGTCGLELIAQLPDQGRGLDTVLCPVGGGGLIAGISTAIKTLVPSAKVCGVEPQDFDDHLQTWRSGGERQRNSSNQKSICDALLAPMPGELTWSINRETVDGYVTVSDREVEQAIAFAFRYLKLVVEPGGAVALAAVLNNRLPVDGKQVVLVVSGGNIDPALFCRCLASD